MEIGALIRRLAGWFAPPDHHRPAVVHRVGLHCPHGGKLVEVDILMGNTGMPQKVVRCSARSESPPSCDQGCRDIHEALAGPVHTLLVLPPGQEVLDEVD
jgi:hypothetical protein